MVERAREFASDQWIASFRDQEPEKVITQAGARAESQVVPFVFDPEGDKVGTVKAAAGRRETAVCEGSLAGALGFEPRIP